MHEEQRKFSRLTFASPTHSMSNGVPAAIPSYAAFVNARGTAHTLLKRRRIRVEMEKERCISIVADV